LYIAAAPARDAARRPSASEHEENLMNKELAVMVVVSTDAPPLYGLWIERPLNQVISDGRTYSTRATVGEWLTDASGNIIHGYNRNAIAAYGHNAIQRAGRDQQHLECPAASMSIRAIGPTGVPCD